MKKYMTLVLVLASCSGRPRFEPFVDLPHYVPTQTTMEQKGEVDAFLAKEAWTLGDLLQLAESINPGLQIARKEVEFAGT